MKIDIEQAIPVKPSYEPISITLTFETEDELEGFYMMMNYAPVNEAKGVECIDDAAIRHFLNERNRLVNGHDIRYGEKWDSFTNTIEERVKRLL